MLVAAGWVRSQRFMVCWKRSTLPEVVGWLGRLSSWRTPRRASSFSIALREVRPPRAKRAVNITPLSVKVENGIPSCWVVVRKVETTMAPVTTWVGGHR